MKHESPSLSRRLLRWYAVHGRHALPWRKRRDPYRILVSEIMLQQTQVERVLPRYRRFLRRFPTIAKLASVSPAAVLRAWRGLGYNRRALYLKRCAQICLRDHGGRLPGTYAVLRKLPGVGDYTARAVLSFAFGQRIPLYETNIRRIWSRVFFGKNPSAVPEKRIACLVERALPARHARQFQWALMDLGSKICRAKPLCSVCPLQQGCKAAPKVLARGYRALEGRVVRHAQSRFAGSDRQLRGKIIDLLRTKKRAMPGEVARRTKESESRVRKILEALLRDELVAKQGSAYLLPR